MSTRVPVPGPLPRRVDKPWGHELWWAHTDRYAGKILHLRKGHRLSLQLHRRKDESSYVLVVHSIEALEDSVVLEVSTPELDDIVRLHDDYGGAAGGRPPRDTCWSTRASTTTG
jgi:mannose-6-phosphate isomerase